MTLERPAGLSLRRSARLVRGRTVCWSDDRVSPVSKEPDSRRPHTEMGTVRPGLEETIQEGPSGKERRPRSEARSRAIRL